MKTALVLNLFLSFSLSMSAHAAKGASILRGGLGFVYPDANSFENPGQLAIQRGTRVEAKYTRQHFSIAEPLDEFSGDAQAANTSIAFGNGMFGIGVFGNRFSTGQLDRTSNSVDSVGAAIGAAMAKERLSLGLGYSRNLGIAQSDDGRLSASITLNQPKFRVGVGGSSTLRSDERGRQTGTAGLGVALGPIVSIEAGGTVNDFGNARDATGFFVVTANGRVAYGSAGYRWLNVSSRHQVDGRLGFIAWKFLDISGVVSHVFYTGSSPAYGGSLRVTF